MNGIALAKPDALEELRSVTHERPRVGPIDLWWAALATALIPLSLIWDFSWESTIGVDRFWSPPHLAMHIGVWLSGLLGLRLIFTFTLSRHRAGQSAGISIGKLCGPSGAWILLWGAVSMQLATLFDNWWQQAYGLGAGLWHPPQILKAFAFFTILLGGLVLCAGTRSNSGTVTRTASALAVWHGGLLLAMCAVVLMVNSYPNWQHSAWFYTISSAVYPAALLTAGRALSGRWAMTRAALACMAIVCTTVWLLPLFSAHPQAPPIHNPTDHLMPPPFPLLLIVPALVLDLLSARFPAVSRRDDWLAGAAGISFVTFFVPVQWFFSEFLLSPAADNWFFAGGGKHWPYFLKIDQARVMFWNMKQNPLTLETILLATALAIASSWIGLRLGAWLGKLRR